MNDKKDLKKKIWLAKLKNTYANTHGNTHVYTYIVKRLEINTQKCCVYLWMGQLWKTFFRLFTFPHFSQQKCIYFYNQLPSTPVKIGK